MRKRMTAMILILAMCLSLCACGKSDAVVNTEELISSIGEVTWQSEAAISAAQQAYDALSEDEKKQVENYTVLEEAQKKYAQDKAIAEMLIREENEKTNFSNAKDSYSFVKAAWTLTEIMADDISGFWYSYTYKKDEMVDKGVQFFVDETGLSEESVIEGLAASWYVAAYYLQTGIMYNDLSETDKQACRENAVAIIEQASRQGQYMSLTDALRSVTGAYKLNGDVFRIQQLLEDAKETMKLLPDDYAHYAQLKELYTITSGLLDFCMSPTGTLAQCQELLNNYRSEARECISELDFTFE